MKISILLPFKENFSPSYAGAVSLFINDTIKLSKFKNAITVYGYTQYKNCLKINILIFKPKKKFLKVQIKITLKNLLIEKKIHHKYY